MRPTTGSGGRTRRMAVAMGMAAALPFSVSACGGDDAIEEGPVPVEEEPLGDEDVPNEEEPLDDE